MKSPIRILSILLIITFVVMSAGCQAAPAAPQAAESGGKWCSGVNIVFFPGGPAGGVFANNVYNGARQAEADLGASVQYVFSDWDPEKMISQFKEAAATKPDGIAVMGHPGDDAFRSLDRRRGRGGYHCYQPEHHPGSVFRQVPGQRLWLCRR
jgi:simple sugar transport system substrate-binding protein